MAYLQDLWNTFLTKLYAASPKIIFAVLTIVIGYFVIKIIVKIVERFFEKVDWDRGVETFIENAIRVILWTALIVIVLAGLGVNVSALVAGLGVVGFVVGFALKDTLGNLASGFFILFYKPFRVGDLVRIAGVKGTVKRIEIAACEITSPENVKITIPNSRIWGDVIENLTGNKTRKIVELEVGVSYDSDLDKVIDIIKAIVSKDKRILKDPAPEIAIKKLADSGVLLSVQPMVDRADYNLVYFDTIKKIKEEFEKNGIEIPFPQQDVWVREKKGKKEQAKQKSH